MSKIVSFLPLEYLSFQCGKVYLPSFLPCVHPSLFPFLYFCVCVLTQIHTCYLLKWAKFFNLQIVIFSPLFSINQVKWGSNIFNCFKKWFKYFEEIKSCHINNYVTMKLDGLLWDFDRNNLKQIEYVLSLKSELSAKTWDISVFQRTLGMDVWSYCM